MVKKFYIFIFTLLLSSSINAEIFNGLDVKGDTLIFAQHGSIRMIELSTKKLLFEHTPKNDTGFLKTMWKTILKNPRLSSELRKTIYNSIKNFSIVNVTFHLNEIYIGFRYNEGINETGSTRFGLLQYSNHLSLKGFCLYYSNEGFISLNPYFPLEFNDKNQIILPFYKDSSYFYSFDLDFDLHEIKKSILIKTDRLKFRTGALQGGIQLLPIPVSVRYTKFKLFYYFPFMILMSGAPIQLSVTPEMIAKIKQRSNAPSITEGKSIDFDRQIMLDSQVLLSTISIGDTLLSLSTTQTMDKMLLIRMATYSNWYELSNYTYNPEFHYIISGRRIVGFKWNDGKMEVITYNF